MSTKKRSKLSDSGTSSPNAEKRSKKKAPKRRSGSNGRPRRVSRGDTAPSKTLGGIERHVVSESVEAAQEAKIFYTDTADAPWTVVKSDCKKRARLNSMRYVLHKMAYTNKAIDKIGPIDPLLVGRAHVVYERGEQSVPLL